MWFLLAGAHQGKLYPAKFGGHKHSGSGDMLYVYYVIQVFVYAGGSKLDTGFRLSYFNKHESA